VARERYSWGSVMHANVRRILVAVGDLRSAPKNELRKAATLARKAKVGIELFHVITEPDPGRSYPETATARQVAERRGLIAAKVERRLERMARDRSLKGLDVDCAASWDFPPHEAIVRRAEFTKAKLVIAAIRRHRFGARMLLTNTDWELIRHCPVPLLLVKSRRPYRRPVVLAAIDPFHSHAKPADLDPQLLDTGGSFAKLLRGRLHVFHSFMPLMAFEALAGGPPVPLMPEAELAHEDFVAGEVKRLAAKAGVTGKYCHLCIGNVADALDAVTRRLHANLVVMGAVSRSALARMFIGNTAERVLDRLSCDVLVLKPAGFKSKILAKPAVANLRTVPNVHQVPRFARPARSPSRRSHAWTSAVA